MRTKNIRSLPLRAIRFARNYYREILNDKKYSIGFYNFWEQDTPDMWLYQFIASKGLLRKAVGNKLTFFSVFGPRFKILFNGGRKKIFYTAENVQSGQARRYADNAISKSVDLSIGFEYIEHEKYLRFPVWLMALFPAASTEKDILEICKKINHPESNTRNKLASLIARHDSLGIRGEIYSSMSKIGRVDSEGSFMKNSNDLKQLYNDNKILYLKNYMFNICPENSDTPGYVTEKIFDAFRAGSIPVYWGSGNCPEPDILNHNSIIFWENNHDALIQKVKLLWESKTACADFMSQPKFLPDAGVKIIDMFSKFEQEIRSLL